METGTWGKKNKCATFSRLTRVLFCRKRGNLILTSYDCMHVYDVCMCSYLRFVIYLHLGDSLHTSSFLLSKITSSNLLKIRFHKNTYQKNKKTLLISMVFYPPKKRKQKAKTSDPPPRHRLQGPLHRGQLVDGPLAVADAPVERQDASADETGQGKPIEGLRLGRRTSDSTFGSRLRPRVPDFRSQSGLLG